MATVEKIRNDFLIFLYVSCVRVRTDSMKTPEFIKNLRTYILGATDAVETYPVNILLTVSGT